MAEKHALMFIVLVSLPAIFIGDEAQMNNTDAQGIHCVNIQLLLVLQTALDVSFIYTALLMFLKPF